MASLRVRYQTYEFNDLDIHVRTLRDKQQYLDANGIAEKLGISSASWPLFGVIWESSEVLAHHLQDYSIAGKRILEVGCGIGLSSLMLNQRQANITATDYHPEAEKFLSLNASLNEDQQIPFIRTGWAEEDSGLGKFDLIIGSDLLYEGDNVELLAGFVNQHAKPHCEIILVDPGRGYHAGFSKKMVSLGFSHTQCKPDDVSYLKQEFKGQILTYRR